MRGADTQTINRARSLRRKKTSAEAMLWQALRNRALSQHKFARQEPIGPYFADFCCRERKLIIELDGATHSTECRTRARRKTHALLGVAELSCHPLHQCGRVR